MVFYRIALMSKDGDWVLRETENACRHVRDVLAAHGARYRPGAPLAEAHEIAMSLAERLLPARLDEGGS